MVTIPLSTETTDYDVIVVGAGYAGLIIGAILSCNGIKTLVIDEIDQVGGRDGSRNHNGYWLDWGHRDARDFGDIGLGMNANGQYGKKAAEAAGADIAFVGPITPMMTLHLVPEGKVFPRPEPTDIEAYTPYAVEVLGVSPEEVIEFLTLLGKLISENHTKLMWITFREWFPQLDVKPAMKHALLRMATIMFSIPPEETSVGRFIQFLKDPARYYKANDPEVGGMQGFTEPYARAIRKHGGSIELGLKPYEILVEDGQVTGVVARDESCTIQIFRAPKIIFDHPIWDLFEVIDESLFPKDLVENARKLEKHNGDVMMINLGLSQLPTIRATGQPDQYGGWNRILRGPKRGYGSGWTIHTLTSKKQAPPGKHLLSMAWGTAGEGCVGYEPHKTFAQGKAKIDTVLEYARQYYKDLDEITEWKTYNLIKAPSSMVFYWKAIPRAPLEAPGVKGLYFVGATTEVDGFYHDISAHSALQVTDLILKSK